MSVPEFADCSTCTQKNKCVATDSNIKKHKIESISDFINSTMYYRDNIFLSFRGHRKNEFELNPEYKFKRIVKEYSESDEILKHFKIRCKSLPKLPYIKENDTWRWLFFAQHSGLATKLLDWTTNPLVALYFAVENIISGKNDDDYGCVWGIHLKKGYCVYPEAKPPKQIDEWIMINPPPVNPRLERQSGKFTYHPTAINILEDKNLNEKAELICFCISSDVQNINQDIRRQLTVMNIHHGSLFYDFDGIANFINNELFDTYIK